MGYERKDAHYRRAKAAGYRARSAYKLVELDDRFRLLARGQRVVDLGCWPGAWLQVAAERVGPDGRVVGIDLVDTPPLGLAQVVTVVGDVGEAAALDAVRSALGGPAAVVLSDLAPKLTGVRDTDEARTSALAGTALEALPRLLDNDGSLLIKLFMNPGHAELLRRLRSTFRDVRRTRPESSRRGSSELYAVARGFHGACG